METIQTVLCHWAPRSLCNNTWCVTLVQATPPFLNAWTEPKEVGRRWGDLKGGWQEGCLGGSNLPSFHFSPPPPSFLIPPCLSFLLLTLPSSHIPFAFTFFFYPTLLSYWKSLLSCFPSLSCRTLGRQWRRLRVRKGSLCWRSRG